MDITGFITIYSQYPVQVGYEFGFRGYGYTRDPENYMILRVTEIKFMSERPQNMFLVDDDAEELRGLYIYQARVERVDK